MLTAIYRAYIACLNRQDWATLGQFVHPQVQHNGRPLGLAGYQAMLEHDFASIPDLEFVIDFSVCEPPRIACRLLFDCTPKGTFLGVAANGRRVKFSENVFYEWRDDRIWKVWSIVEPPTL